ncbi:MAG: J domain-containing protein [Thermodesulfobacteriota bacterium]|nr:J domain-containing protein [Thermodesulfobacteriota bacterium]
MQKDGIYHHRDLFELGFNPSEFIVYPGGNAYYIDEVVEERLDQLGVETQQDELDDLFWPYVKPRIRRAVESFRQRGRVHRDRAALGSVEKKKIHLRTHIFDKRRIHFLKSGRSDQRGLGRMPAGLLRWLQGKSRDEIEQRFMRKERVLRPGELKSYVYVIFNLKRFFSTILAERAPETLDQEELDTCFVKEICRLNRSAEFWGDPDHGSWLHEYLARYLIIYFDTEFSHGRYLQDELRAFINRHRAYRPPTKHPNVSMSEASALFGVAQDMLEKMTLAALTRRYRRLALKHHPDRGGDPEMFIRITEAYRSMARMKEMRH